MDTTANLGLGKPLGTEDYDIDVHNTNSDLIDAAVGDIQADILTLQDVIIAKGEATIPFNNENTQNVSIDYSAAGFASAPVVVATAQNVGINVSVAGSNTATAADIYGRRLEGALQGGPVDVYWIAIGVGS